MYTDNRSKCANNLLKSGQTMFRYEADRDRLTT